MNTVALEGKSRTDFGKKATQALRKENLVPCVMYGGKANTHFFVAYNDLKDIVFTDKFVIAKVNVEGKETEAILKDADFHPVTDRILHCDFQELVKGTPVKVQIPVRLTGLAAGVKEGGKLELNLRKLMVKAIPENLVTEITLDVTALTLGKSIKVRDVQTDLEIINPSGIPIAQVVVPRAMKSAASKAAPVAMLDAEEEETEEATEEASEE